MGIADFQKLDKWEDTDITPLSKTFKLDAGLSIGN